MAVLLVLVITSVALVISQRRLLVENLDEQLSVAAAETADRVAEGDVDALVADFGDDDSALQITSDEGEVLASTPNIAGAGPLAGPPEEGTPSTIRTTELPHETSPFRVLSLRVEIPEGPVVLHAAATLEDVTESTQALTRSLMVAVPTASALLAAVVWWLVGRTLAPVEAIRRDVASIGGADLHRRVPEPGTGDEIDRLAHTMNRMLSRIESSSEQQRRFIDDASHELRSPLTRMRTELEVDLAHPGGSDPITTHQSLLEETVGLQRLVEDLLALARLDAAAAPARRSLVELDDIVLREVSRIHTPREVEVRADPVSVARVTGDADQLSRAVRNLVENAVTHATTTVTVGLVEDDGSVVLSVADDGPGIPADQRGRVFERFSRLDEARSHDAGGTGLGLAITRAIVEAHDGEIRVEDHRPGAKFVIRVPSARSSR